MKRGPGQEYFCRFALLLMSRPIGVSAKAASIAAEVFLVPMLCLFSLLPFDCIIAPACEYDADRS